MGSLVRSPRPADGLKKSLRLHVPSPRELRRLPLACTACGARNGLRINRTLTRVRCRSGHEVTYLLPDERKELERRIEIELGGVNQRRRIEVILGVSLFTGLVALSALLGYILGETFLYLIPILLVLSLIVPAASKRLAFTADTMYQRQALELVENVKRYGKGVLENAERRRAEALKRKEFLESLRPREFEFAVAEILRRNGYETVRMGKGAADFGADVVVREGGDEFVVQVKQWAHPVQRQELQKLQGAMIHFRAGRGIFVTLGTFSSGARQYGALHGIKLVDGGELIKMGADSREWLKDGKHHLFDERVFGCGHHMRVWWIGELIDERVRGAVSLDCDSSKCSTCAPLINRVALEIRDGLVAEGNTAEVLGLIRDASGSGSKTH